MVCVSVCGPAQTCKAQCATTLLPPGSVQCDASAIILCTLYIGPDGVSWVKIINFLNRSVRSCVLSRAGCVQCRLLLCLRFELVPAQRSSATSAISDNDPEIGAFRLAAESSTDRLLGQLRPEKSR